MYQNPSRQPVIVKSSSSSNVWITVFTILFLIIIIVLSYFGLEKGYINAIIAFIAYIASYIIYKDKKSVGAMWCFGAAFVPWLLYAIY